MSPSRVLSTRTKHDGFLVERRRECLADPAHRFTSFELPEQVVNGVGARLFARLGQTISGAEKRRAAGRVRELLAQGWKPEAVAAETGYTTRAVQKIRSRM